VYLESERKIDIFFPPVLLEGNQSACLEMTFTSFAHFEVKLAYATAANNAYKERIMFRSIESLGEKFQFWKATITPYMTEGQAFVVVLHSRRTSVGIMALIRNIQLRMEACLKTGKNVSLLRDIRIRLH